MVLLVSFMTAIMLRQADLPRKETCLSVSTTLPLVDAAATKCPTGLWLEILTWSRVLSEDEMRSVTLYLRYDVLGFKRPGPLPSGIPHHNLAVWFPSATADKDAWLSAVPGGRMLVGSTVGGDVNVRTDEPGQDGAVGPVRCLYGDHNAQFTFGDNVVPTTFTMCSLTRYTTTDGRYQKRILIGGPGNFLHGHWMGLRGVAYYDNWMTQYQRSEGDSKTDWLIMCGTNGAARQLVDGNEVANERALVVTVARVLA